jgi:hypothetical protein
LKSYELEASIGQVRTLEGEVNSLKSDVKGLKESLDHA